MYAMYDILRREEMKTELLNDVGDTDFILFVKQYGTQAGISEDKLQEIKAVLKAAKLLKTIVCKGCGGIGHVENICTWRNRIYECCGKSEFKTAIVNNAINQVENPQGELHSTQIGQPIKRQSFSVISTGVRTKPKKPRANNGQD